MEELRVPTVAVPVEIVFADGRRQRGRIFAPAAAATHAGAMRPDEWLNSAPAFVPFLEDGQARAVLLHKNALAAASVPARSQAHDPELEGPLHAVWVECAGLEWRGQVAYERPRLLDFLNAPESFLVLRDGTQDHLLNKHHVTRVGEIEEG